MASIEFITKRKEKEIIKAFEVCRGKDLCNECAYAEDIDCLRRREKDAIDLMKRQRAEIDDLTRDTIPKLRASLARANKYGIEADKENKRLNAEIERLHNILLSFTNEIHFWSNKYGYDTTELSLIPILNEAESVREAIKAEAVKEFAERLHKGIDDFRDKREMVMLPYTESALLIIERKIDLIAKEMVGEQE